MHPVRAANLLCSIEENNTRNTAVLRVCVCVFSSATAATAAAYVRVTSSKVWFPYCVPCYGNVRLSKDDHVPGKVSRGVNRLNSPLVKSGNWKGVKVRGSVYGT